MKLLPILLLLSLASCTTVNLRLGSHCYRDDGSFRNDDPTCNKDLNRVQVEEEKDDHSCNRK
jgi:hypothetical protein